MPLRPATGQPAAPVPRAEALRPLLVEADHDALSGLLAIEGEDPSSLDGVLRIGALLPAARALQRDPVAGEDPAQLSRRDRESLPAQVASELGQAPARIRHPERRGTGAGNGDDAGFVVSRDPGGRPPPRRGRSDSNPCRLKSWITLRTCDSSVSSIRAISGALISVFEASRIRRPLPRRGQPRLLREPLQALPLSRGQLKHEHLRGRIDTSSGRMRPTIRHQCPRSKHVSGQAL